MKIIECEQGSVEWMLVRLGIPTASAFNRLLTTKTLKPASAAETYRAELLAEWLMGQPQDWDGPRQKPDPMEDFDPRYRDLRDRGTDLEAEARRYYELVNDVEVREVGFILHDSGDAGGSPDGLVDEEGGVEIKSPGPKNHMVNLLHPDDFEIEHRHQCQGLMWLTGRKWWDLISFHPTLPKLIRRLEPDSDYHQRLEAVLFGGTVDRKEVASFLALLRADKERFAAYRQFHPQHPKIQEELRRAS